MPSVESILKNQIEFYRNGIALLPKKDSKEEDVAFYIGHAKPSKSVRFCSCRTSKRKTCAHLIELSRVLKTLAPGNGAPSIDERFRGSYWYYLADILAEGNTETGDTVQFRFDTQGEARSVSVLNADGEQLVWLAHSATGRRFLERCGKSPQKELMGHRGSILKLLVRHTLTADERTIAQRGYRSRRQVLEESFWFRMAYHFFIEFGVDEISFKTDRNTTTGEVGLLGHDKHGEPVFQVGINRGKISQLINWFSTHFPKQQDVTCHPIHLSPIFKVSFTEKRELEVVPHYVMKGDDGQQVFFDKESIDACRYGELAYVAALGKFVRIDPFSRDKLASFSDKMVVRRDRVPAFLDQFSHILANGPYLLDEQLKTLKIHKTHNRAVINSKAIERDWCWISVEYGFGESKVSLEEILSAKRSGKRFIETSEGWVDVTSPDLEGLDGLLHLAKTSRATKKPKDLKLSRLDVFRLQAASRSGFEIKGKKDRVGLLRQMLSLKPSGPLPAIKGMTSTLREYQQLGVEWGWFIYTSRFGGLLCDDMGLGKTHQAMALMLGISTRKQYKTPFLVICPTTVLSHWERKIEDHAPELTVSLYHGSNRDLSAALKDSRVILTSYGVLRKDMSKLSSLHFPMVIFDEIQYIKNSGTQAHQAAAALQTDTKIGLTGTPIENSLSDLKALMDLTVPGYLGSDSFFRERYISALRSNPSGPRQKELSRLISPFTLRRLKKTVLPELPDKIEDIRFCKLSSEQVKLYKDAVAAQGQGFLETLGDDRKKVPYIHIFALLGLLKQICDHPALLDKSVVNYETHGSGKWELFKELLAESLDSGQKVVVYSQFLGMIRIISAYLKSKRIGHVTLTGASRKRGEIIDKFNNKPNCRVYVGSLKAGGTGVDLVAGSVVIHYDRWWNAAKEDQATDRVHRIGQHRGVQVFKLVTQGTLEEKISALIDEKRNLMDSIVKEDDPGLLKSFSREELIDILSIPIEFAEDDDKDFEE
jgi:SNF2 family DNA or RNA helicase